VEVVEEVVEMEEDSNQLEKMVSIVVETEDDLNQLEEIV